MMKKIDLHNYEEYLLSYADNELDAADAAMLLRFLEEHPELRHELELLQHARLSPEPVVFSGKESLYRNEEKIIPLKRKTSRWWMPAAAAALAALIATGFWQWHERKPTAPMTHTAAFAAGDGQDQQNVSRPAGASGSAPRAVRDSAANLPAPPSVAGNVDAKEKKSEGIKRKATTSQQHALAKATQKPSSASPAARSSENAIASVQPPAKADRFQIQPVKATEELPIDKPVEKIAYQEIPEKIEEVPSGNNEKPGGKLLASLSQGKGNLQEAREALDDKITDKVTELQEKLSHPLKDKTIRIGHIQIAFN